MLDPKKQAEVDQSMAALVEMNPPMWRSLYDGCIKEGFTEEQSLELIKTFIMSQSLGDKRP